MSNHYGETAKKFQELFVPAIVIFISCVIAIIMLVTFYTTKEDTIAYKNSKSLVTAALNHWTESSHLFAIDYATWDDAVENIIIKPNKVWIENNFYSGVISTPAVNGLLAINKNKEILAYNQEDYIAFDLKPILMDQLHPTLNDLALSPEKFPQGAKGQFYVNGLLISYGIYPFTHDTDSNFSELGFEKNSAFLIIFRTSDQQQLLQAGQMLNIENLTFTEIDSIKQNQYVILDSMGNPSIALKWKPIATGTKLLKKFFPITLIVTLFLALVVVVLYKRWSAIINDLNHREEKQRNYQNVLADISDLHILEKSGLTESLNLLFKKTLEVIEAENILYWELNEDQLTADCLYCYNCSSNDNLTRDSYSLKALGIFPLTHTNNTVRIFNNLKVERPYSPHLHKTLEKLGINKIMSVRFYSQNKFLGILTVERIQEQGDFTEDEALFFRAISNTLSLQIMIDNQKKLSAELTIAKEISEQASLAKSSFLANMSHELRTPLNAIIGFAEILNHKETSININKFSEYAELIRASGAHLLEIVNDLLDIAKIESGKVELVETVTDLRHIWEACAPIIMNSASQKNITLVCEEFEAARIEVDKRIFKQIFMNLLYNSIKFTHSGGIITLTSYLNSEGGITVEFKDTGVGIKESDLQKVLEPFSQVENHLTKTQGGTGLGLPLVKSFIEMHQGTFVLESEFGVGTTAKITIPKERIIDSAHESTSHFI